MKYAFPAVFTKEESTEDNLVYYNVKFPDIYGCVTFGENLDEASDMAKDALLCALENDFDDCRRKSPSSIEKIHSLYPDAFVYNVEVDVDDMYLKDDIV